MSTTSAEPTFPREVHATARGPRWLALCVVLALAAWAPAVWRGGWSYDDREVLERNPVVQGSVPWSEAFRRDYWEHVAPAGHFRPIATLSLRVDRSIWGDDARGFHATNVLLHAACVAVAGAVLLLASAERLPWFGLALFAVHPVLADSVAWVSGRTSMLAALAGLLGALAIASWITPWRDASPRRAVRVALAAGLGACCALLAKEDGAVFAPLYVVLAAGHSRRVASAAALGALLGVGVYLVLRWQALGSFAPAATFAPLAEHSLFERALVGGRAALEGLRLAVAPLGYPPNYERAPMFARDSRELAWLGGLGWALLVALAVGAGVALRRKRSSSAAWSALLAAASALPMLQLIPAGALFAPRFLYMPLLFAAPLVGRAAERCCGARLRSFACVALALSVWGAWSRSEVYSSRAAFHRAQLAFDPTDARSHNELGLAFEEQGDAAAARSEFERAIALDPEYGRPWSNLGRLALADRDEARAEQAFRRAIELGAGNAQAHTNLAILLQRQRRPAEALTYAERALALAPGLVPAWRVRARALADLERFAEAHDALNRALQLDPRDELTLGLRRELKRR